MNSPASAISTESLQTGSLPEGVVPPAPHASMPTFGLLVLGDELLSGRRADKHVPKAIELLGARGLALSYVHMIGDDRARIADQLRRSFASGDVVFSCGGIGATPDDHTRQAAAEALGVPLAMHPAARAQILARMRDVASEKGEPFDEERADNLQRLQMAMFPEGASIIPNPYNRIAGFSVGHVHFMPGFPVMAWPMMEWVLDTFYARWFERRHWVERSIIVRKAYEAALTPLMERLEAAYPGIKVFSLPSVDHPVYGPHIDLGVKGGDQQAVDAAFEDMVRSLGAMGCDLGPELRR